MAQVYYYPPVSVSSSSPSTGTNGTTAPTSSTEVGGIDRGTGFLQPINVDSAGNQNVNVVSSSLPTGSATAANQVTGNNSLASIDSKTPALGQQLAAASQPVVLTAAQFTTLTPLTSVTVTQATGTNLHVVVDSSGLPTGAATAALQTTGNTSLATIATNTGLAQGSTTSGQAGGLTLAAVTTAAPSYTTAQTSPLSLTLAGALRVDGSAVTQPISAAALPLPTNAATSALQTTGNTSLATIVTNSSATQGTVAAGTAATKADLIGGVFNTALPTLTTGQQAAAQFDSSARLIVAPLQTGTNTIGSVKVTDGTNTAVVKAASTAAVAADTSIVVALSPNSPSPRSLGRAVANAPARNDYTVTSVTTAAFVQLVASTTSAANRISIFDSSGQTLALAVGAAASEVIQCYIFPGGNGDVELAIPAGSRVSVKAISATASVGELDINFLT